MARYQRPPDPRQPTPELRTSRPRRQRQTSREPIPWLWLGLGAVVTIAGIVLALSLATAMLAREPLVASLPTPTIVRLTAPPSPIPSPTRAVPTPTPIPTLTASPTPVPGVAPPELIIGFYAAVANTDGIGVSVRGGPSTDHIRLLLAPEGTLGQVIGGPEEGGGFIWWQLRLDDGTEGWIAADFLVPAVTP
jgi:hypothetical protein